MLALALEAAVQTGGAVDPTLGEAIEAAGYDRDFASLEPDPSPARPGAGGRWRAIRLRGQILSRPPGLKLDLNGVVKGQTVDEALALIEGDGLTCWPGDMTPMLVTELPAGDAELFCECAILVPLSVKAKTAHNAPMPHAMIAASAAY